MRAKNERGHEMRTRIKRKTWLSTVSFISSLTMTSISEMTRAYLSSILLHFLPCNPTHENRFFRSPIDASRQ